MRHHFPAFNFFFFLCTFIHCSLTRVVPRTKGLLVCRFGGVSYDLRVCSFFFFISLFCFVAESERFVGRCDVLFLPSMADPSCGRRQSFPVLFSSCVRVRWRYFFILSGCPLLPALCSCSPSNLEPQPACTHHPLLFFVCLEKQLRMMRKLCKFDIKNSYYYFYSTFK